MEKMILLNLLIAAFFMLFCNCRRQNLENNKSKEEDIVYKVLDDKYIKTKYFVISEGKKNYRIKDIYGNWDRVHEYEIEFSNKQARKDLRNNLKELILDESEDEDWHW